VRAAAHPRLIHAIAGGGIRHGMDGEEHGVRRRPGRPL